ncbi:enoyl-CoA hydratase/isomerase family protein [Hydrogenophaga crocea]|uniref:Enoyl-CoA hydratase/isomerase family protein n=1 Tax=Hydrogenophaga crocea TaxID=2716225 RepID=A0A6G8IKL6_9BURK|nr:enoyl-CoA hydratase/isomerase family protein [Hydrogenophaga crocea]QIM53782.1 enoyl-CoA hydratase/isomerase family protein [Hydrogenophaga crocea]
MTTANEPSVVLDIQRNALWMRLNRPAAFNAITADVLDRLDEGLALAAHDPAVRVLVVTGAGRAFCVGADLKAIRAAGAAEPFLRRLNDTLNRLEACAKPVVAMVNGTTLAGGLELVLCCDLVVAARSARLGDGHARYGLLPGGGASARLPRAIGASRARYLLHTGDTWSAEAMRDAGLVHEVADDEALLPATQALVDALCARSPLAQQRLKALLHAGQHLDLPAALALEQAAMLEHQDSEDLREGLAAFIEKREPRFTGR